MLLPIAQMGKLRSQQQRAMKSAITKVSCLLHFIYSTYLPHTHLLMGIPQSSADAKNERDLKTQKIEGPDLTTTLARPTGVRIEKNLSTEVSTCFPLSHLRKEGSTVSEAPLRGVGGLIWKHLRREGEGPCLEQVEAARF